MSISHHRARVVVGGRNRKARPKTFQSEEAAKKWAEAQGITKFSLLHLRAGISKKIKVVEQE